MPPLRHGPCGLACDNACGPDLCRFRPASSQESSPRPLRAPRVVKARRATRNNRLEWLQVALHLEDTRGRR